MERQDLAPGIFTISDVLTADECQQLIALAEKRGFDTASIKAFSVDRLDSESGDNDRAIVDDVDLAKWIWSRVEEFVPRMLADRPARGLNEHFRFHRYDPGQRLAPHWDGSLPGVNKEVSLLTFMLYLNEGYEGGETRFESLSVAGKRGTALLFEHRMLYEGAEVTGGVKYVLRSEVMYGPWTRETPTAFEDSISGRWRHYEDFCRAHNESMVAFVARIAPLAIAENIYPHRSLAWLGLRKAHRPRSVLLLSNKHGSRFGIRWYKNERSVMYTVKAMDSARWQRIVAWLDVQD